MDTYTFEQLKSDLALGHEIEFYYRDEKYSISYNETGWYFTRFGDENYQTFTSFEQLLNCAQIEGMSLEDIWSKVQVDTVF